ncbi:MAG: tryptophan synthase subunit alpha [Thermodesulforhabdaceae bacterium]
MNRIGKVFGKLREKGEKALVGYITAGDPSIEKSFEIAKTLCTAGVDILELGMPFSDPTADGPVIQRASMRALKAGMTLQKAFEFVKRLRKDNIETPVILFSYYNPLFRYGGDRFYKNALESEVDGVLVVDLPPEESKEFTEKWNGWTPELFSFIRLIAPTTTPERMGEILKDSSGFVYLISKTGVTGSEEILPSSKGSNPRDNLDYNEISRMVQLIKTMTTVPVCVGFGVSTPAQAARIAQIADGVVIGSAFEKTIEEHQDNIDLLRILDNMVMEFKKAMVQQKP